MTVAVATILLCCALLLLLLSLMMLVVVVGRHGRRWRLWSALCSYHIVVVVFGRRRACVRHGCHCTKDAGCYSADTLMDGCLGCALRGDSGVSPLGP